MLIIGIVIVGAFYVFTQHPEWIPSLNIGGSGGAADMVDVNKKIQFTWTAMYSGAVANTKTFYVYGDDLALRETLATAATGIIASAQNYPSGTKLHIKYDDGSNQIWHEVTVPQMNVHDSESNTYNDIALKYYAAGTYTSDQLMMLGLNVASGETVNASGNATTAPTFIYTLSNTGVDNTGLADSYDPVYGQAWQTWVTGKITGNNASLIIVNGADYSFAVGNDYYFACRLDSEALSKWKVGLNYVPGYTGTDSCSWSLDLSGFTATSTATMTITAYSCADPAYAMSHAGNFGATKVTIAAQTVTIVDN
jgi:hypothetical protein